MKALTLHQPYASLIADGRKPFETRSWKPPRDLIGKRIAIHAGRRFDNELANASSRFGYAVEFGGTPGRATPVATIPLGFVVCTAELRGAYRVAEAYETPLKSGDMIGMWHCGEHMGPWGGDPGFEDWPGSNVDPFGDFTPGRWLWWLTDVVRLDPPVPAKGRQGLWNIDLP